MRFLCLPGAYGSAEKFQVQLAPFVRELESDNAATFHFIQGPHKAVPPEGFEDFFGGGEFFRFIEPEGGDDGGTDVLERIRDFPEGISAEDTMRELMRGVGSAHAARESMAMAVGSGGVKSKSSAQDAIDYLYKVMAEDGPFDGIIGYSEGATVAGTLLLCEQRRFEIEGIPRMFKCALFFAGWPPMNPDLNGMVLSDESDLTIDVPTCHIVGSLDPYIAGSIALYNVCDLDTAYLFDHAKGHTLPRDKNTVKELGDIVRRMAEEIQNEDS